MAETLGTTPLGVAELTEELRRVEERLEALEHWREQTEGVSRNTAADIDAASGIAPDETISFDVALIGRTLIVLAGAFLLRAATEGGALPAAIGVALGLLYAVTWSLLSLRTTVTRNSATYHAIATTFTALPLIFEGVRKFDVLAGWSAALALAIVASVMSLLVVRRRLYGIAWMFVVMTVGVLPMLAMETKSVVPFMLFLTAVAIGTLWLGYVLDWRLLSWLVAVALDFALVVFALLVATGRLPQLSTAVAIAVPCLAFAAYLGSFALRALRGHREAADVDIVQGFALLLIALGGAMWIAMSRAEYEQALTVAILALGAISYAVSFTFVARQFTNPRNFVFTSSLALMLVVLGGSFVARGLANSIFWSALAVGSAWFATHFRKSSLALHAAVYLFAGFIGASIPWLGLHMLFLAPGSEWIVPPSGALLLFVATLLVITIRPIERQGTFELWTAAKIMTFVELGWIAATLGMSAAALLFFEPPADAGAVSVARTAVIAALTIATAWVCRFPTYSPARTLCNPLLIVLGLKLLWEDIRSGRPATLFVSFAIVGAALILVPRLRRKAAQPQSTAAAVETLPPAAAGTAPQK